MARADLPRAEVGNRRATPEAKQQTVLQNPSHSQAVDKDAGMPSFDIVSRVNSMEIENAVNIANKELANRFDFRGANATIVLEKNENKLAA